MLKAKAIITLESDSESDSDYSDSDSEVKKSIPVPTSFRAVSGTSATDVDDFFVYDNCGGEDVEAEKPTGLVNEKPVDKKIQELLSKAVCKPDLEKKEAEGCKPISRNQQKKANKLEADKTTGRKWFDMPATELTEENKMDLELLRMRNALDPLAHYRKQDSDKLPKYFQVGRVVDAPEDYYSGRMTKKERKNNMVDELLADMEFQKKKKEAFNQIKAKEAKKVRGTTMKRRPSIRRKDEKAKKKRR